jgi:hypothetical protein
MKKIVLISCVKTKLNVRAKAKDLYISQLFRLNLEYAKLLRPDEIYILSAKYGLLDLDQEIDPYEKALNTMTEADKKAWSKMLIESLRSKTDLKSDLFIFLAGIKYRKYLLPELMHYEIPLEGLAFGKQKQELKRLIA